MQQLFARRISPRHPFALREMPTLSRFHRYVTRQRTSRKAQLLIGAPLEKIFSLYFRKIAGPAVGELEFQSAQGVKNLRFNARNLAFDMFYGEMFKDNYEDETGVLLDAFLPLDGCLFDVGSNWGFFSLYAASRGGSPTIHAFEPIPSTFEDLKDMVGQAGLAQRITCHNTALSDSDGETEFQVPLHSASAQKDPGALLETGSQRVRVRKARLDSLKLGRPDYIKIDAEWHEAAVLRGAEQTLRESRPFLTIESKISRNAPELSFDPMRFVVSLGYNLFLPTLKRVHRDGDYLVNCGYQVDTGKNQKVDGEDVMVLVPFDPTVRFLLPQSVNLFACHRDRMNELQAQFSETTLRPGRAG
jgi:FkbM family methyltransferase